MDSGISDESGDHACGYICSDDLFLCVLYRNGAVEHFQINIFFSDSALDFAGKMDILYSNRILSV